MRINTKATLFNTENALNVFRPGYTREIWKRDNHQSPQAEKLECTLEGYGYNHIDTKTSSILKTYVFKTLFTHTKTPTRRMGF